MAEEKDQNLPIKIVYVGDDEGYWNEIKTRIKAAYSNENLEFLEIPNSDRDKYQSVYVKLLKCNPTILYMDLARDFDLQVKVAQMVKRDNLFQGIPVIGLVDDKENKPLCVSLGIDFIHLKCGEYHDVVYDPFFLLFPKKVKKPEFVIANFQRKSEIYQYFRVGYITPKYIHVEGDYPFQVGEEIELEHFFPQKYIKSQKFKVKEVGDKNLFYNFRYWYNLEFTFLDKPVMPEVEEGQDPEVIKAQFEKDMQEYEENLQIRVASFSKWLKEKQDLSKPKNTKVLIVDPLMQVLEKAERPLDSYKFAIRCQTHLRDSLGVLDRIQPNIIGIQNITEMDSSSGEDEKELSEEESKKALSAELETLLEFEKEALDTVNLIAKKINNGDPNYRPYVVLFNAPKYTSASLQNTYKYGQLLAFAEPMSLELLLNMATAYEKKLENGEMEELEKKLAALKEKDPKKFGRVTKDDLRPTRLYINKKDDSSYAILKHEITYRTMTESEMKFVTKSKLELGQFGMREPADISVTLVPNEGKDFHEIKGEREYKALINFSNETDKKELRKAVNDVFFAGKKKEREREQAEFAKLNEAAKAEAEKAASEGSDGGDDEGDTQESA